MNELNKDFYNIDGVGTPEMVDAQIEAFNEFLESVMEAAIHHMSSAEKLDAKKYRMSAQGKKAIAKYLKKSSRAGYKVNKALSKKMKQVAKLRREDVDFDLYTDSILDSLTEAEVNSILSIENTENLTESQKDALEKAKNACEMAIESDMDDDAVMENLTAQDIADIDSFVEEVIAFCESDNTTADEVDPETGETLDEFKHMSATAKAKAKKYRMSAQGKKAIKKYLKKAARSGYKVDKKRSAMAKKLARFRNESVEDKFDSFDADFLSIVMEAEDLIKEYEEAGIDIEALREACKKQKNESDDIVIMVPVEDDEDEITSAADENDCVVDKKDEESGAMFIKGSEINLRALLDKLGYEDSVEDLMVADEKCCCDDDDMDDDDDDMDDDDMDDMDEAFKRSSSAQRAAQRAAYKLNKNKASFKKARAKYERKKKKAGYKVDKTRSREMAKIAKTRVEAIESSIDAAFAASPLFGELNEAQTTEMKAMYSEFVNETLEKSYEAIEKDVREGYEAFINENLIPEMKNAFDNYAEIIQQNVYETLNDYLIKVADDFVNENEGKTIFVKSAKSETLESFTNSLLSLIKEQLCIIPEREDALQNAKNEISKLSSSIRESAAEKIILSNKLAAAQKDAYMYKALQEANVSDYMKDALIEFANTNLDELPLSEFKKKFDKSIEESLEVYTKKEEANKKIDESKNYEHFDFMKMFGNK